MGSSLSVIDIDRLERVAGVPAELGAGAVDVDLTKDRVYCANFLTSSVTVVDGATLRPIDRFAVGEGPCAVAVDERREELYVVNCLASTVSRIDTVSGRTRTEVPVPNAPVGIALGRGGRVYVASRGEGVAAVLGPDGAEWAQMPVGAAPGGLAVHPCDDRQLLVTNAGSGSLTVLEDRCEGGWKALPPERRRSPVGRPMPDFHLPDLRTGHRHRREEWTGKKYIVNFFASW
jgi:DNA-binding beta-propeller fold protein YncE